ncbi:MAG: hypothetical protein AAF636_25920 [Pseudomonadota bacterium]
MSRIAKLMLSGFTAVSLSLTPIPATAGPDGEDLAKALAGFAVIGLIASAANDRKKKRQAEASSSILGSPFRSIENPNSPRIIGGEIRRPRSHNGNIRNVFRRAPLPDRCLRIVSTVRGDRAVYGARCLSRNYVYSNRLPDRCELQIRTQNRIRNAYGVRCLRRDGWQVARF